LSSDIQITQKLIIKDLEIDDHGLSFSTLEKLKTWLTAEIRMMIDRDFQKLLNMLYRIDVDEQKSKIAFADDDPAVSLAELIIERELKKVETRKKYR
jgi:hypothetical protein